MRKVLVIAYGNPLRSDDGIAWQAAEALRRDLGHKVRVICVHQLTPEITEDIALADMVIFLDALRKGGPGHVICSAIFAAPGELHFSHYFSPSQMLELCRQLYLVEPRAFLISINGTWFGHGRELSPAAVDAIPEVVAKVSQLIEQFSRESGMPDQSRVAPQAR